MLFLTAALLFVSATLSPVVVQSSRQQDLDTLEQQVQKLYREGKYSEAIPYAERYVAITKEALGEGEEYVGALNLLALNYKAFSRFSDAERLYKTALATMNNLAPDTPKTAVREHINRARSG